ncbi:hypothetical protein ABPG74_019337 [Tetrahymena malaccensis]
MNTSCYQQTNFQNKSYLLSQYSQIEEKDNSAQQSKTLSESSERIQFLSQKLDSIFSKMDDSYQRNSMLQNRELVLQSKQCSDVQDDSKADIDDHDSQESINSTNSFIIKSLLPISEKFNRNVKQQIILKNSVQPICNSTSIQSASSTQIQKSSGSDLNQKEKSFFLNLPLNQSRCFLGNEESENDNSVNNQTMEKSRLFSLKSSLQKRVTFQDLVSEETYSSLKFQKDKQEVKVINSESRYQLSLQSAQKATKSILKKHQSSEFNLLSKSETKDAFQTYQINMDFFNIKNEEVVQNLLEKEVSNFKYQKKYFFSELTTKISNSGEKKQKIIFISQNCFYVLEDLSSNKRIQKFDVSDIKKIIIHQENSDICSIISIFKCVLKSYLPILQKQKQHLNEEDKINLINNNKFDKCTYLRNLKLEFNIKIHQISRNKQQNDNQTQGTLQFFQNNIWISTISECQELNRRPIQVELCQKDLQNRSFTFQSKINSDQIYLVQLQYDQDFPYFINKINEQNTQQIQIK